jgi:hypothetical protein
LEFAREGQSAPDAERFLRGFGAADLSDDAHDVAAAILIAAREWDALASPSLAISKA